MLHSRGARVLDSGFPNRHYDNRVVINCPKATYVAHDLDEPRTDCLVWKRISFTLSHFFPHLCLFFYYRWLLELLLVDSNRRLHPTLGISVHKERRHRRNRIISMAKQENSKTGTARNKVRIYNCTDCRVKIAVFFIKCMIQLSTTRKSIIKSVV